MKRDRQREGRRGIRQGGPHALIRNGRRAQAHGRSLCDFKPLKPAEDALLAACRQGRFAEISENRPDAPTPLNTVRADFIRFLLLDGDESAPVHGQGVRLRGAWIEGALDLENMRTSAVLDCRKCRFAERLNLSETVLYGGLFLHGTLVPGIDADGLVTDGSVFLRDGFESQELIRLLGARIGGNLECTKGIFCPQGWRSITADGMQVIGALIFREISPPAQRVSLASASVGRLIDDGESWGEGLILDGFRYGTITGGAPKDAATRIAWLNKQRAKMSCHSASSRFNVRSALRWLKKELARLREILGAWIRLQSAPPHPDYRIGAKFCSQPWRQLHKVLLDAGLPEDARQVAIAFEVRMRKANLIGTSPENWSIFRRWAYRRIARNLHLAFWLLTGYGHRPLRLIGLMLASWFLCGAFYLYMALPQRNVFAPTDPVVFQHPSYAACRPGTVVGTAASQFPSAIGFVAEDGRRQFHGTLKRIDVESKHSPSVERHPGNWYFCRALREEYAGFSPWAYSLDVLLPFVDLHQEKDWAPMISAPHEDWWKEFTRLDSERSTRLVIWSQTLFGWIASLLLVAIVSGLAKRREE